jgi:hypothetical protein
MPATPISAAHLPGGIAPGLNPTVVESSGVMSTFGRLDPPHPRNSFSS